MIIRNARNEYLSLDKNSENFFNALFSHAQSKEELILIINDMNACKEISIEKNLERFIDNNVESESEKKEINTPEEHDL